MTKIGSCTIIYNPDKNVLENINSYINLVKQAVIVDNSNEETEITNKIKSLKNIVYINMDGNKGIAAALNKGLNYLIENDFDYVLTMDQDSIFPNKKYTEIMNMFYKYSKNYSIVGLNFNKSSDYKEEITEVKCWLTSGNFLNLNDYKIVGGFNNDLFIDYVDIDFCYRLYKEGKKVCYLNNYSLLHEIGNPIEIKFFGRKYYSMNHNPIRYYYRYRNCFYLYKKDKKFYKKEYYKEIFINIPKMLIYEKNRKEKIKMIFLGIKDARNEKMGVFK